jgi:flavin-dependent thymidylate synthase
MKVTLIDYTGAGTPWPALYAAKLLVYVKNTRLTQGQDTRSEIDKWTWEKLQDELKYIATTIRSSWEFVDYTWEIQGVTRAFTHQLVRTRTASYAQQAQRVVDLSQGFDYSTPETVTKAKKDGLWRLCMDMIASTYKELHDAGVPTQDCRGVLPTNVLTNIIMKANLRTFADLVGKRENLRAQSEYADVVREMKRCVLEVHPWAGPFLNPERTTTPELDSILKDALGDGGPLDKPHVNTALKQLDALKGIWG